MAGRKPGIRQRMEVAALELYERNGLDATTAQQIAAAAGTTERTFFRHFRDKIDSAFGDESRLLALLQSTIGDAEPHLSAWKATQSGLTALCLEFENHREAILRRSRVVANNPALHERELSRTTAWVSTVVSSLEDRGVSNDAATVCAAAALAMFRVALERWSHAPDTPLRQHLLDVDEELAAQVVRGRRPGRSSRSITTTTRRHAAESTPDSRRWRSFLPDRPRRACLESRSDVFCVCD